MQPAMKISHVIVDGSNIATEGRDAPSLAQLDEAVQAFIEEYAPDHVTVVVDATFPNRIDRKERHDLRGRGQRQRADHAPCRGDRPR